MFKRRKTTTPTTKKTKRKRSRSPSASNFADLTLKQQETVISRGLRKISPRYPNAMTTLEVMSLAGVPFSAFNEANAALFRLAEKERIAIWAPRGYSSPERSWSKL